MAGALGGCGVGGAELRGPGEVEEVVVEGLGGGVGLGGCGGLCRCREGSGRLGWRRLRWIAAERGKREEQEYLEVRAVHSDSFRGDGLLRRSAGSHREAWLSMKAVVGRVWREYNLPGRLGL